MVKQVPPEKVSKQILSGSSNIVKLLILFLQLLPLSWTGYIYHCILYLPRLFGKVYGFYGELLNMVRLNNIFNTCSFHVLTAQHT